MLKIIFSANWEMKKISVKENQMKINLKYVFRPHIGNDDGFLNDTLSLVRMRILAPMFITRKGNVRNRSAVNFAVMMQFEILS